MTREERKIAVHTYDNGEFLQLLKTHRVCFNPSWSKYLLYVQKNDMRRRATKEKIEYTTSENSGGGKIIILKN